MDENTKYKITVGAPPAEAFQVVEQPYLYGPSHVDRRLVLFPHLQPHHPPLDLPGCVVYPREFLCHLEKLAYYRQRLRGRADGQQTFPCLPGEG